MSITLNGHTWTSRVAIMRGRYLLGLSNANRKAAGVSIGDDVVVEIGLDANRASWSSPTTSPAPSTQTPTPGPSTTASRTATSASTSEPS